jgi:hypothetical protein
MSLVSVESDVGVEVRLFAIVYFRSGVVVVRLRERRLRTVDLQWWIAAQAAPRRSRKSAAFELNQLSERQNFIHFIHFNVA